EVGPPLNLEPQIGALAPKDAVPTIGLPLLIENRCYPSSAGLGLNSFDVSLAINSSARPAFRAYSAGGIDTHGQPGIVDPDAELFRAGGLNPYSSPPGGHTLPIDNVTYIGQLDLVYRVNRIHSAWFDTGASGTDFAALVPTVVENDDLGHVPVHLDVRGATGFSGTSGAENDASRIDAYGELRTGTGSFLNGDSSWKDGA